jgi:hypothetical protein
LDQIKKIKDRTYTIVKNHLDELFDLFNKTNGHRYRIIQQFCIRVTNRTQDAGFTYQKKVEFLTAAMRWINETIDYYKEESEVMKSN